MNPSTAPSGAGVAPSLRAHNLGRDFDRHTVLDGVNFHASPGEIWVITGPNGAGKSTLLRVLAGLLRPTRGRAELVTPDRVLPAAEALKHFGYVAPDMNPYEELSVRENLEIMARIRGMEQGKQRACALIESVGLSGQSDSAAGTLSTGRLQRLKIALALLHEPPVLLLDEPWTNLDTAGRDIVSRVVEEARRRGPVIVATNDPEDTRLGNHRIELEPVDSAHAGRP